MISTKIARGGATALAVSLAATGAAVAASPDAGSLLNQQQQTMPRGLDRLQQGDGLGAERPAQTDTAGQKVVIRQIRFTGAEGLATDAELQAQVSGALGKALSFGELEELAAKTTRFLKSKGWMLARAYLPKQDLTEGVLEIAIIQGRIEGKADGDGFRVRTEGDVRLGEDRVRKTLAASLFDGDTATVHSDSLERGVLLLNDLPGVQAKSSLEKGAVPGTTRIGADIKEGSLLSASVWGDNYGNRYTGALRGNALGSVNDAFGWGDQFTVLTTGASGLLLGQVGYSLPLGYSGLRAHVSASALKYDIGKEQESLESEGRAYTQTAGLSYPVIRSRDLNLWANGAYSHKSLIDESLGAKTHDKRVNEGTLSLNGDRYDQFLGGGLTNYQLGVTAGKLDLSALAADLATDQATARTDGNFGKLNYGVARLQKLDEQFSLFGSFNGQYASKNLDSSEKFIVGGPSGVRAYPTGEGSGDNGWVGNVELRYDVPGIDGWGIGTVQLVSFYDLGHVTLQKNQYQAAATASGDNSYLLQGAGLGVNVAKTGEYSLRAAWAIAIGDNPGRSTDNDNADGKKNENRFWLQAMVNF